MTIPLTGSGGLMTRNGHLAGYLNDYLSLLGGTATTNVASGAQVPTRLSQIEGDYAAGTALYSVIDGFANTLSSFQSSGTSLPAALQTIFNNTIVQMAQNDSPLAVADLTNALNLLIQQMTGVASINSCTVSIGNQTAVGTPTGNPVFVLSKVDGAGQNLQMVYPEKLSVSMTSDDQIGATAGSEPYSVLGYSALGSLLDYRFLQSPYGSGCNVSGTLVDGSVSQSAGSANLLENSDFATVSGTASYPANWIITVGTAGVTVGMGSGSNAYTTGGGSLEFLGDGTTLAAVTQQFDTTPSTSAGSGGTAGKLVSSYVNAQPYAFNCWVKMSATPAAGALAFDLIDGSASTINDDNSVANSIAKSLTAVSTSWVNVNGVFRLPAVLPSTIKLRIRQTTAIDSGKNCFIGRVSLTPMKQLYGGAGTAHRAGGPFIAGFSGNTAVSASGVNGPDSWTFNVTNTVGAFAKAFWQFCNLPALGLVIPFSGSSTVNDNLVA